jgi:hypothetical protein
MATLGEEGVLFIGVSWCDFTLPTVVDDDILKVSITFFSNTFTTMDSVSAEKKERYGNMYQYANKIHHQHG